MNTIKRTTIKPLNNILQFIKYALIGASNVLIEFTVLNLLAYSTKITSGLLIYLFDIIAFILYSVNGYNLNKKFTFNSNNSSYFKYSAVLGISAFFNSSLTIILTGYNLFNLQGNLWMNLSKLIASITIGLVTFIINKFFIFKN